MPTLEEVSKWSSEQIRTAIYADLPSDWVFDTQPFPEYVRVSYKDEKGIEVWAESHWNVQFALLAAYGWLWMKREPAKGHPVWRVQPSRVLVPVRLGGEQTKDPEDLDPKYIASVYAEHHRRKG